MLRIKTFKLFTSKNIILTIDDLSFDLGTFSYIQGDNSTGKSLFLSTLAGQYKKFTGEIIFKNKPLLNWKNDFLLLNNDLPVIKKLDYIENIQLSLGRLGTIQKSRLLEMATILDIVDNLKTKMEYSSRCERMFMYLIRAALLSPSILMIDDIDDYFDETIFDKVYQVISLCLKSGMLVISTGKSNMVNNLTFKIDSGELRKYEPKI